MRYKIFTVVADVYDYNPAYGVELGNVEIHNVNIVNSLKTIKMNQVFIGEDQIAFNFDIWGDVIDFLDFKQPFFNGSEAINSFIDESFPHIKDYYGSQI